MSGTLTQTRPESAPTAPHEGPNRMPITCSGCDEVWFRLGLEHCTGCHQTFASTLAGDKHQSGPWTARVCHTPEELIGMKDTKQRHIFEYVIYDGNIAWRLRAHRKDKA